MPDDGADTIGTAPSLMCRKRSCSACSAPGFLDFQHHRFAERLEGRLDLVEERGVIKPEQTIAGFAIPAKTAHQLGAGDTALTQRAIERGLERRHQRQRHRPAARSFGSRRDVLAAGNACRQRLLDRVDGMHEGIGVILAEGGHLRQARAGGKHGAVVVRLELDRLAQRHFSPKSLRILLTKPLPNSLRLPCIGELALTVPAPLPNSLRLPCIGSWLLRSPRRTVTGPLPPLWVSKVQPLEASSRLSSCAFMTYNLFHSSVEVHKDVEFGASLGFACNSHASCAAASHPIPSFALRAATRAGPQSERRIRGPALPRASLGRASRKTRLVEGRRHRSHEVCPQGLEADTREGGAIAGR